MLIEKTIVINHGKGIHARAAASIVHRTNDIQGKYGVEIFISAKDRKKVSATSLMPLVNLKIKDKEKIIIQVQGKDETAALDDVVDFFKKDFGLNDNNTINQIDNIIDNSVITMGQIFQNIVNGIIVTDEKDNIIIFNSIAEKFFGIQENAAIGKKINEVIENSRLNVVNNTGKSELMIKQVIGERIVLINRTPVVIDGKVKGAIGIFQDISSFEKVKFELDEVKELQKRLQLILQSVQDGICFIDAKGNINYVNDAYINILGISRNDILEKNIREISPNGARHKVLVSGKSINNAIIKKENGITVISNINPVVVDNKIIGVVSVVKNLKQVEKLTEKLSKVSAKAEYLEEELIRTKKPEMVFSNFIGKSGKIIDALSIALKAAQSNATILIRGESGTGKELIAEGIHYASTNYKGPFIRVNCAAIPKNLLESELFGHEKGAFTGAIKRKLGKFELAQNGTMFLDEIGELEKDMQSKILRAIQEKEFQRVGGEKTIKINVRIIAATNRNLEEMVKKGEFREDLYYRLNVIPIFLPPLRDRKQDIALLVEHFMNKFKNFRNKKIRGITNEAMEAILSYPWPGNVRELENLFERLYALVDGEYITIDDMPPYICGTKLNNKCKIEDRKNVCSEEKIDSISRRILDEDDVLAMKDYEKLIIEKALKKYGSYNAAGKALGLTHKTIASKARKYNLEKKISWEKVSR
ncbi:HPr family phosphocarrier protein [Clostridium algifaecis]|uniref:HPr family phosphocarrier protein n=1 Tax=Clostridium algifaecis TaxID=1472040 RepID=UPI001AE3417C|nr:HPr family phosphocarrier protein [Clostridium algifaecis]